MATPFAWVTGIATYGWWEGLPIYPMIGPNPEGLAAFHVASILVAVTGVGVFSGLPMAIWFGGQNTAKQRRAVNSSDERGPTRR